jgi:site-specific recombinase XerC
MKKVKTQSIKNDAFSPLFSVYLRVSSAQLRVTVFDCGHATFHTTQIYYDYNHSFHFDQFIPRAAVG